MKSGIYQITCTENNHFYLGQSSNLDKRWHEHLLALNSNRHHNIRLQNCFSKYGESSLTFTILEECEVELLNRAEQNYLDQCIDQSLCINFARDATAPMRGRQHCADTKIKIGEANTGIKNGNYGKTGDLHPYYGKKVSEETKKKLSDANKGTNNPMFGKKGILCPNYNKTASNETRHKSSASHSKSYTFLDPNHQIIFITNLRKFCIDNNLSSGNMCNVANGKLKHYKGWIKHE